MIQPKKAPSDIRVREAWGSGSPPTGHPPAEGGDRLQDPEEAFSRLNGTAGHISTKGLPYPGILLLWVLRDKFFILVPFCFQSSHHRDHD